MAAHDVVIVGGGHNGLVATTLLARAGRSVLVLERNEHLGGAAVSQRPWPGVDARVSRYAYLVSLFPRALARELGLALPVAPRRIASYSPASVGARAPAGGRRSRAGTDTGTSTSTSTDTGAGTNAGTSTNTGTSTSPSPGLLVDDSDPARTRAALGEDADAWYGFYAELERLARAVFPTLTEPLRTEAELRERVGDDALWDALVHRPIAEVVHERFASDLVRGTVLTDALIGTFASAAEPSLRQNRCFLYHVVGNGTGAWDVPIGGMGALTDALAEAARRAGAELRTNTEVTSIEADGRIAEVRDADGRSHPARFVLANVAPRVLATLRGGETPAAPPDPGAQLKVNMLLTRLPRFADPAVAPHDGFAGTLHVNESAAQLETAYAQAAAGVLPDPLPVELYCHSLADPTILGPELRASGAHTLTLFSLQTSADLFRADPARARREATAAALASLNGVLAEPVEDCLARTPDGETCLEAKTPLDLEAELGLPAGNIFHRDLAWPWAEDPAEAGRWGVETETENVLICGAGARRGGGVSGIAGHNAARAVLER